MRKWQIATTIVACGLMVAGVAYASNITATIENTTIGGSQVAPGQVSSGAIVSQEEHEKEFGPPIPDNSDSSNSEEQESITTITEKEGRKEESQAPLEDTGYLSKYSGQYVEFVGFEDQELTDTFTAFIISNLSSNECNIAFEIKKDSDLLYQSVPIAPGISEAVSLYSLLGKGEHVITVVSQAYAFDGTPLNAISQDVTVIVKESEKQVENTAKDSTNRVTGAVFNSVVVHSANTTNFTITIPAAISVVAGTKGTQFVVGFRVKNMKEGNILTVTTKDGLNGVGSYQLVSDNTGDDNISKVECIIRSGDSNDSLELGYGSTGEDALLHWIGPAYCIIGDNKTAADNYYGIVTFYLNKEDVNEKS